MSSPIREEEAQYPRPLLQRRNWTSLDGSWDFILDPAARFHRPGEVPWESAAQIQVPFSPETPKSGIGNPGFYGACWYRRVFQSPRLPPGHQLLLHFGAVDYVATVFIDGVIAYRHQGGYTPFTVNITKLLHKKSSHVIIIQAQDNPHELTKPRGKQDWQLQPHSIWYPRTTGIWQTIWLECVSSTWISRLRFTANLPRWEIGFEAWLEGEPIPDLCLSLRLHADDQCIASDTYEVVCGEVHRRIALSDPGIDDYRNELLWSPEEPKLIQAEIRLWAGHRRLLDEVSSYTAIRSVGVQGDRFLLNGRPYFMRLVLDQGYWPESGLSAPDTDALKRDVQLIKSMGFNGVRMHQKVEDPRFLYWADRLGLLVWEEMPSAYRFTQESIESVTRQWMEVLRRDVSHPCIAAWVPFNESWGVPNLPSNPAERHYVQALYHLTKTLDPTRPVVGNDGWESVATDIIGIHDYDTNPERIASRYHSDEVVPRLLKQERPGGRSLILDERLRAEHPPLVLSEFGGIALCDEAGWGYSRVKSPEELQQRACTLIKSMRSLGALTGTCYTQFVDTYQERNGLLFADRTPKFPLSALLDANLDKPE